MIIIDKDEMVFCINCINYESLIKKQATFFGCNTELCSRCPCFGCDCYEPELNRKIQDRPLFVIKKW